MTGRPLAGAAFWGQPGLLDLLALLNRDGEEARVVGGAVRNALLGQEVSDVDIATTALPEVVSARARAAGLKAVPTGIAHGTVTVVAGEHAFEVTTLREDTETDGRRAVVRFGRSWTHDAERRDFTINALYATAEGEVIDLVDGRADLARRRVRFIGDADARIREDYLRVLRLFRFHAFYGEGAVDGEALGAAVRARAGLLGLSRERVRAELLKLLLAPRAAPTLAVMSDCGLIQPLLAGLADAGLFARLVAAEARHGVPPDAVRRLAALALRGPDDAERLREKLRLSNAEARRLAAVFPPLPGPADAAAARRLIYQAEAETALDRALLGEARWGFDAAAVVATTRNWIPPRLPVKAEDLMARGLKGPALGKALERVEQSWIKADFPESPAQIHALVAQALGA
ncbi:CCA tRNA nucleotidyltransferase [Xanthobacter tagetidis]|uniref:CCA tRNA nucleotidyltransferase n=1 Tax=Xanthobacter tagetidis TaxID=60216 RepID=A0A3L7A7A8_9HYPH|nr:CCA tRNA nucleotidyltransferase [Xanthobacter tagetidis]MBB6308358.1 poly(A) polymerase [Xanthobacter tagetidis]RLP76226.1 CCA tRNA nucleotidyltransferase [Xanthobacter tagetidis]